VNLDREDRLHAAERSATEAKNVALVEISRDIWDRLENIKLKETEGSGSRDSAVAFVAWVESGRLVMPWEKDPNTEHLRRAIEEPEFSRRIEEAARAEFAEKRPDRAADVYRDLLQTAANDQQRASVRLKLAPVLRQLGRQREADGIYRDLLNLPSDLVDDGGISFASTAAMALLGDAPREVLTRAVRAVEFPAALTLDQAYRWRTVLKSIQESADAGARADTQQALSKLSNQIGELEKSRDKWESNPELQQLRIGFPTLGVSEKSWLSYGPSLLLSRAYGASGRSQVIAVHGETVLDAVRTSRTSGLKYSIVSGSTGQALDVERLPGLKVRFADVDTAGLPDLDLGSRFWLPSTLLVLCLNLFGGYLLWRDTRREARLTELRSQFVASVSHELKTPLTAIRMFGEILQAGNPIDHQTHSECVDTIVNESERLTRLLNNVLDFSRIEHGQKSYRLEPTRLSEVVSAAAKTMQYPLAEQGFDLHMDIDEKTPPIDGDRDALKQAVLNLLTNAMKYSGTSREIGLRLVPENGAALIQISDHGIGIPELEKSRIFEKFYRAHVRENQSISGTGLGLALVAHIVQGHGGSVQVESSLGMGSTFSIRLPIHAGGMQ
jgi:signal transduction histidine kinase/tetratricopeptide (TPR) repeat protein